MSAVLDLPPVYEVDARTERAIIEMIRLIIREKPAARDVDHWDSGWVENLSNYTRSGNIEDLKPKYIRRNLPLRRNGRFVLTDDPEYEWRWYRQYLARVATEWLDDCGHIVELGCGSGHNVVWLARRFPDKLITGTDWSKASVAILREMRRRGQTNVEGRHFNFYEPPSWDVSGAVILTVGSMEQTGKRWRKMLEWFLAHAPKRVVHIEPQISLYDPKNPVDQTAIDAHLARGFWTGYWEALLELEREGKVEVLESERQELGSLLIEGYSLVIWRPL